MLDREIGGIRHVIRAIVWLVLIGLFISFTGTCRRTTSTVDDATLRTLRGVFDESKAYSDPLCVQAGPFPFRSGGSARCDACQSLEQAGLLSRRIVEGAGGGYVEYGLTELGKPLYRVTADADLLDPARERLEKRNPPGVVFDPRFYDQPRLCLGKVRFHSVSEALAPFVMGTEHYLSVKIVAEAKEASNLLFDPRLAPLSLKLPTKPESGQPILFPPEVVTFQFFPGEPRPEISSTRYGAWVNEP